MSTNKSQNLNLHLWEPEDDFLRTEFNENFAALDTAVKAEETARSSAVSALQTAVNSKASASALNTAKSELTTKINTAQTTANNAQTAATKAQVTANAAWSTKNPGWVVGSYKGTNTVPAVVKLGFRPSAFYVVAQYMPIMVYPATDILGYEVTWMDDGISWCNPGSSDPTDSYNSARYTYYYIAFR